MAFLKTLFDGNEREVVKAPADCRAP